MKKLAKSTVVSKVKMTKEEFLKLHSSDKRAYTYGFKREPATHFAKYQNIGGIPHKMVDGVLVPLTRKNS